MLDFSVSNPGKVLYRILSDVIHRISSRAAELVCELLSALCSAASKYFAAVSVRHSLAEAMFHLAMTLLRLVCSFHDKTSILTGLNGFRLLKQIGKTVSLTSQRLIIPKVCLYVKSKKEFYSDSRYNCKNYHFFFSFG